MEYCDDYAVVWNFINLNGGVVFMKPNLGLGARYMRTALGLTALTYASGNRKKMSFGNTLLVSVGAMKVAEGITGWCPMQYLTDKLLSQTSCGSQSKPSSSSQSATDAVASSEQSEGEQTEGKSESRTDRENQSDTVNTSTSPTH